MPKDGRLSFRRAIVHRLLPTLRAFNPSLILLSTGFDTMDTDVGNMRQGRCGMDLTLEDIQWVTAEILKVADICCNGRMVSVLEGGYGALPKASLIKTGDSGQKVNTRRSVTKVSMPGRRCVL